MPELIGMCDRIVVLHEGLKTAEFSRAEATPEAVLRAATADAGAGTPGAAAAGDEAAPARRGGLVGAPSRAPRARPPRGDGGGGDPGLASINPLMLSPANLTALAMDAALLAIATLAQLLVLITRNIDLSVASVIGLAAYGSALT